MQYELRRERLKNLHFISTIWFVINAGYMLIAGLLQTGRKWWVIVSVSGYSALIVFLLISLYLFAVFKNVAAGDKTAKEHSLTTSVYYLLFYYASPFIGTVAGIFAAVKSSTVSNYLLVMAAGSLWVTFLVWIMIDPLLAVIEILVPPGRQHWRRRLARARVQHAKDRLAKEHLLAEVQAREQQQRNWWRTVLTPAARELATLLTSSNITHEVKKTKAVDIGVDAWQMGGLNCMQQLHSMAMEISGRNCRNWKIIDYVSIWWDGIGSWRSDWLEKDS